MKSPRPHAPLPMFPGVALLFALFAGSPVFAATGPSAPPPRPPAGGYLVWDKDQKLYRFADGRPAPTITYRDKNGKAVSGIPQEAFDPDYRKHAGALVWDKDRQEYRPSDGSPVPLITYYDKKGKAISSGIPVEALDPNYRRKEGGLYWDQDRGEYRVRDGSPVPIITRYDKDGNVIDSGIPIEAIDPDAETEAGFYRPQPRTDPPPSDPQQESNDFQKEFRDALDPNGTFKSKIELLFQKKLDKVKEEYDLKRQKIQEESDRNIQRSDSQYDKAIREREDFEAGLRSTFGNGGRNVPGTGTGTIPAQGPPAQIMDCNYYAQRAQACRQAAQEARASARSLGGGGVRGGSIADTYLATAQLNENAAAKYDAQYRQCQAGR